MFPEDYEINARNLTEAWMAEGFIKRIRNMSVIDVAEEYLEQLIDRSLIQVARKRSDGGVKTCRVHDLLRDLCIRESSQDKFLEFYSKVDSPVGSKSRRYSFQNFSKESLLYLPCTARSLLLINSVEMGIPKSFLANIFTSCKFIRVLCLINTGIRAIPSKIEQLVFLRCLWIKESAIKCLPSSISKLYYLETIRLETRLEKPLPEGIWSVMINLTTLYVQSDSGFQLSDPPRRLMSECLWNLQVLFWLPVDWDAAFVIAKFPNLRKLGLKLRESLSGYHMENVMTRIGKLESLQSFKFVYEPIPKMVWKRYNSLPSTLTKISLKYNSFQWEHFDVLARNPHVRVLKIESFGWQHFHELNVIAGDFPQLEVLKMRRLRIKTFTMEKNAMPNLQRLNIKNNFTLKSLPDELWSRTTLQLVEVSSETQQLRSMFEDLKMKYSGACKIIIN